MRTMTLDIAGTAGMLIVAAVAIAFWIESRDSGRYELVAAEATIARFRGRMAEQDRPESRLYRIDTRTGRVEVLQQTVYEDSAFITHLGGWSPVDTLVRYPAVREAGGD